MTKDLRDILKGTIISAIIFSFIVVSQTWLMVSSPVRSPSVLRNNSVSLLNTETIVERKQRALEAVYPDFKGFSTTEGFAGHRVVTLVDDPDHYFVYEVLGSGVPIAQGTCFRVDRLSRVYKIGDFPDPLDQVAGYTDVDPKTCHGLNPPK